MSEGINHFETENRPGISPGFVLAALLAVLSGALAAVVVLPAWLPALMASMEGENLKVFWFLSRGTAIIAYFLLWASMVFGLLMSNKFARQWPGAAVANDIHKYVSLFGLGLVVVHALILTGDRYISMSVLQALVPFASINYRPFYVGLGQIGLYLWAGIILSFYVRQRIGNRAWRMVHYVGFVAFLFALVHGLASGTDTSAPWMAAVYWVSAASLIFLTAFRILSSLLTRLFESNRSVV